MKKLIVGLLGLAVVAGGCHESGITDGGAGGTAGSGSGGSGGSGGGGATGGAGGAGAAGGAGGSGGHPSAVFPLQIATTSCAPNCNRYLVDQNGNPFFIHGEAGWSAMGELTHAEMDTYLNDIEAKGFNTVLVTSPEGVYTTHSPTWSNARGDLPMTSGNIGRFNPTYLNEAYYDYVDHFIAEANERNILIILAPLYGGYNDNEGWVGEANSLNTNADMTAYGNWLGTRYDAYPNLMYVWYNEAPSGATFVSRTKAAATATRGATNRLGMVHNRQEQTTESNTFSLSDSWLSVRTIYRLSQPFALYDLAQAEYQDSPVAPTIVFEPAYEQDLNNATALDVRIAAYHGIIAGAMAGHLYGAADIWDMDSRNTGAPDWDDSASLNREGRVDMQWLKNIFEGIEWWKLVPSFDASILKSSRGSSDAYVSIAKTSDSRTILAYTSRGGDNPLTIDTTRLASGSGGTHDWRIINPATGAVDSSGTARANGTAIIFDPAGSNADYVVVITDAGP